MNAALSLERLLTVDDVLESFQISRSTLHALVRCGSLKAVKIGRRTLFRQDVLRAFIEERETQNRPATLKGRG